MVDGVSWILRTGAPWRDRPAEFGARSTVRAHFNRGNQDGTLAAVGERLQREVEIDAALGGVDGTVVRAAKYTGGGGKKESPKHRRTMPSTSGAGG
jgi:transposase